VCHTKEASPSRGIRDVQERRKPTAALWVAAESRVHPLEVSLGFTTHPLEPFLDCLSTWIYINQLVNTVRIFLISSFAM
jgi:hypothetical protein